MKKWCISWRIFTKNRVQQISSLAKTLVASICIYSCLFITTSSFPIHAANPSVAPVAPNYTPSPASQNSIPNGFTPVINNLSDDPGNPDDPYQKIDDGNAIVIATTLTHRAIITGGGFFALGSFSGPSIIINSGATLGGHGPFTGPTVNNAITPITIINNGTISPSGGGITSTDGTQTLPIGTHMCVHGNIDSTNGAFDFFLRPPTAQTDNGVTTYTPIGDKVSLSGILTVDSSSSSINVHFGNESYTNTTAITYPLMSWGALTGTLPQINMTAPTRMTAIPHQISTGLSLTLVPSSTVYQPPTPTNGQTNTFSITQVPTGVSVVIPTGTAQQLTADAPSPTIDRPFIMAQGSSLTTTIPNNERWTFTGALVGGTDTTFILSGTGNGNVVSFPTTDISNFSGTMHATNVKVILNSSMPGILHLGPESTGSGNMVTGGLIQENSILSLGNSIGQGTTNGNMTANSASTYQVEIDPTQSDFQHVTGTTTLASGYTIKVTMDPGSYSTQVYTILTADSGLFSAGTTPLEASDLNLDTSAVSVSGTNFALSIVNNAGSSQSILLTLTISGAPVTVTPPATASAIESLSDMAISSAFQGISQNQDIGSSSTSDAFRFTPQPPSKSKNLFESIMKATAGLGPVDITRNQTRLWISPYVNRTRAYKTANDPGNQGWSGGSLVGIEQRNQKDTWTIGLLTGMMGARSHLLGQPNTYSATKGFIGGVYNSYKYTQSIGHELLVSRTTSFVNAQRYGLDTSGSAYYALSKYRTTTDIGNAQLNYKFDVIKNEVTCRLDAGVTYQGNRAGSFTETEAGNNNLSVSASRTTSIEYYTGVGLRKIWNFDQAILRLTGTYEYGYNAVANGTGQSIALQSSAATTYTQSITGRQNKHYIQVNGSYLNRETGIKFVLSYAGKLYKNVRNHMGMVKLEYRY